MQVACPPSLLAEFINSMLLVLLEFAESRDYLLQASNVSYTPADLQSSFRPSAPAWNYSGIQFGRLGLSKHPTLWIEQLLGFQTFQCEGNHC